MRQYRRLRELTSAPALQRPPTKERGSDLVSVYHRSDCGDDARSCCEERGPCPVGRAQTIHATAARGTHDGVPHTFSVSNGAREMFQARRSTHDNRYSKQTKRTTPDRARRREHAKTTCGRVENSDYNGPRRVRLLPERLSDHTTPRGPSSMAWDPPRPLHSAPAMAVADSAGEARGRHVAAAGLGRGR